MSIEVPAERLRRRLGAEISSNEEAAPGGDDEQSETSLSRWLPESPSTGPTSWITRIRADPGRAGVVGLGVLGVVAVLVTVLSLISDRPPAVVSAKLPPVEMVSSEGAAPGSSAPGPTAPVVSVIGLVATPGLVTLAPGARIADALDAAGGPLDGADVIGLNMARRVTDGEQIVVGIAALPGGAVQMGSSTVSDPALSNGSRSSSKNPASATTLIDLNRATANELETLPGVGPVTASAIVSWRETNGRFANVDQLGDVDGIGPARLDKLRDHVRV